MGKQPASLGIDDHIRAIQPWAPLFLLGIWADSAAAGIFGATTRMALLVSFFLIAINNVLAPRFAALHKQGDFLTISRRARRFALSSPCASPVFLAFIFAGDWVMSLFGADFANSGRVLAILAMVKWRFHRPSGRGADDGRSRARYAYSVARIGGRPARLIFCFDPNHERDGCGTGHLIGVCGDEHHVGGLRECGSGVGGPFVPKAGRLKGNKHDIKPDTDEIVRSDGCASV